MSEHGWPDFHDDGGFHHDDGQHHEELPQHHDVHDAAPAHDEDGGYFDDAVPHHDLDLDPAHADVDSAHEVATADVHHEDPAWEPDHDTAEAHDTAVVGHDPDALPEPETGSFPPILDVGPLPEPVDGFPWIDTGSLGVIDPATVHAAATTEVEPHELAEYAGAELPPGADPWAALADSDDPATSALAKWWSENG